MLRVQMKAALYNHLRTHVVLNERAGARQFHFEADPAGQGRDAARETQGHVARGIRLVFQWRGKKKKKHIPPAKDLPSIMVRMSFILFFHCGPGERKHMETNW
jgi:hypothetical protein